MMKAKRSSTCSLPYALLISRICKYKGVKLSGEKASGLSKHNMVSVKDLKKMGLKQVGDTFTYARSPNEEEEEEAEDTADEEMPQANTSSQSDPNLLDHIYQRMDDILNIQLERMQVEDERYEEISNRHEEFNSYLKDIDRKVTKLNTRMSRMEQKLELEPLVDSESDEF